MPLGYADVCHVIAGMLLLKKYGKTAMSFVQKTHVRR